MSSNFDNGFVLGLSIGQSKGGGGGDAECDAGRTQIENAIMFVGGVVIKVGAIPTFDELETSVLTILENYPLRLFNITDTHNSTTLSYTDIMDVDILSTADDTLILVDISDNYGEALSVSDTLVSSL